MHRIILVMTTCLCLVAARADNETTWTDGGVEHTVRTWIADTHNSALSDSAKWNGSGDILTTDYLLVNNGTNATLATDQSISAAYLYLGYGWKFNATNWAKDTDYHKGANLNMTGGALSLTGTLWLGAGYSDYYDSILTASGNASISAAEFQMGDFASLYDANKQDHAAVAKLNLSGSATMNVTGLFKVGCYGSSSNEVNIAGTANLTVGGDLEFGDTGTSIWNQTGGTVSGTGNVYLGNGGTSTINLNNATISTTKKLNIANGGTTTISVTNSTISASQMSVYNTDMIFSGGSLTVAKSGNGTGELFMGQDAGHKSEITLDNGANWTLGAIHIGRDTGEGKLIIDGNSTLTLNYPDWYGCINLGWGSLGTKGTLILKSGSKIEANGYICAGRGVNTVGLLDIQGGTLTTTGSIGAGHENNSTGTVQVATGATVNANEILIGNNAASTGYFNMAGGEVKTTSTLAIGQGASSYGEMTIDEGTVNVGGSLQVGNNLQAFGKLTVNGGYIKLASGNEFQLCQSGSSTGEVYVTGGALVNEGAWFCLGHNNDGNYRAYMEIDGGAVSNLLNSAGGGGNFTVGSLGNANSFSELVLKSGEIYTDTILYVGEINPARMTMSGGKVLAKSALCVQGSSSDFIFNGGVFETDHVYKGANGRLTLNGGTFKARAEEGNYFENCGDLTISEGGLGLDTAGHNVTAGNKFTGTGTLTKSGAGTLTLSSGDTDMTGDVVISNGVVNIGAFKVADGREVKMHLGKTEQSQLNITGTVTRDDGAKLKVTPIVLTGDYPYPTTYAVVTGLGFENGITLTNYFTLATESTDCQETFSDDSTGSLYDYTWSYSSGTLYVTLSYNAKAIAYATWIGGNSTADPTNNNNWSCTDKNGTMLSGAVPKEYTTLLFTDEYPTRNLHSSATTNFTYAGVLVTNSLTLSKTEDWSGYPIHFAKDVMIDLKSCDLTLGSYWAHEDDDAFVAFTSTRTDGQNSVLTLGANNGVMGGNTKAKFLGKLQITVTGSDATPFSTAGQNTHTGGWIFKDNNSEIKLKVDTSTLGTGPVRFNGNGGFTTHPDSTTTAENVASRTIYVTGPGNKFVGYIANAPGEGVFANRNWFLDQSKATLSGTGELEIASDLSKGASYMCVDQFQDFTGKIIQSDLGLGGNSDVFLATATTAEKDSYLENVTWQLNTHTGSSVIRLMADNTATLDGGRNHTLHFGDLRTASETRDENIHIANNSTSTRCDWYFGYRNNSSPLSAKLHDAAYFYKVGTGTVTMDSFFNSGYTTDFTIQAGRVNWNYIAEADRTFIVESGATLGGTYSEYGIKGEIQVKSGGTLAPTGVLYAGKVTFESGSNYKVTLNGEGYATGYVEVTGNNDTDTSNATLTIDGTLQVSTSLITASSTSSGKITGLPTFTGGGDTWIVAIDVDEKALVLEDMTAASIAVKLAGDGSSQNVIIEKSWVESNLVGESPKPYASYAAAISGLRSSAIAPNGLPYAWCYALGLSTTVSDAKPTLGVAVSGDGWVLSPVDVTIPAALEDVVTNVVVSSESPDFEPDYTELDSHTITPSDVNDGVKYFRIKFKLK